MRQLLMPTIAAAAAFFAAGAANAQQRPILVVDTEKVLTDCNACRAANTQLQTQQNQLQSRIQQRATALDAQLKPERDAIQKAIQALGGKQPDAALQKRAQAYEQRAQAAQTELQNIERQFQSTVAHVRQQVGQRVVLIAEQVRARRQAAIVIGKSSVMANDSSIDVTTEVLAALNQQLPAVSVTPLPQQQQAQPQGR
jgi:outer membrane protein